VQRSKKMVPNATCPICRSERRRGVWEWEEGKGGGGSRRIECADEVLKKSPSFGTVRLAAVHHVIDFEICFGTTAD